MTLLTLADDALDRSPREIVRLDEDPSGAARARVTSPALLGLADHRHADRWWRDLRLDPSVGGVAAQRAQPTSMVIEHGGEEWPVTLPGLLGCALAWSPFAPRVAGLAVQRGCARPWIADYAERTLRIVEPARAATSLTGLDHGGAAALCWLDPHTLAFLAACGHDEAADRAVEEPLIYDATGPGYVSFEPGLDDLLAAAGVAVARLDPRDETVEPLTGPLLVRGLRPLGGRRPGVLVCHATGLRDARGRDGLVWSDARLDLSTPAATLEPVAGDVAAPPAPAHRPPRVQAREAAPRLSTSTRALAVPGMEHAARLAVFAPPPETERPAANLLWIRASRGPLACSTPVPAPLPGAATPAATLDLPLHWPADATLAALHDQIAGAAHAAAAAIGDAPIVVGGHSFGATLALFALAHVPGLAGAIAHSGCYNRTHTPFGFHYERRRYWDVPDIYDAFSALRFADRIRRPVLIVHGLEDANPATHPDHAAQLYRAIVATGGTARLVLLPREEHSFRYRETHERLTRIHRDWLERAADAH